MPRTVERRTLEALSIRTVHLVVLCALVALAVAVFATGSERRASFWSDGALLAYVPADATLVLTADLAALRDSEFGALVPGGERDLPGVGKLSSVCGFDPTAHVRSLAVALSPPTGLPSTGDELGVIAGGDFRADAIRDCARRVISKRQGHPDERRLGAFMLLSGGGEGVLAMREHGPVLLGDEAILREMIRASEHGEQDAASGQVHRTLRRALGPAPLVATWDLAGKAPRSGALLDDLGAFSYATSAAAALRVKPASSLEALVLCDSLEKCSALAGTLNRAGRLVLTELLGASLGSRDLEVRVSNREVRLRLPLAARDFAVLFQAVAAWL